MSAATAVKLLAYCLDPSCNPDEAANAATMFVKTARRDKITLDVLASAIAPSHRLLPRHSTPTEPPACSIRLDFGKYDGLTLGEVAKRNPGYLDWIIENLERKPWLQAAAKTVLEWVIGGQA